MEQMQDPRLFALRPKFSLWISVLLITTLGSTTFILLDTGREVNREVKLETFLDAQHEDLT